MRILVLFWRFAMLVGGLTVAAQGSTADLATSRIDRVREAGVLRVCIWPDYYSITYRNPKTQVLSGIDIDPGQHLRLRVAIGDAVVIGPDADTQHSGLPDPIDPARGEVCGASLCSHGQTADKHGKTPEEDKNAHRNLPK